MHDTEVQPVTGMSSAVDTPGMLQDPYADMEPILYEDLFADLGESSERRNQGRKYKLYKRRWFMLFIFSLSCIGNAINFTTIAAINKIAASYYNVNSEILNWIPNSFLLVYMVVGLPSAYVINVLGLRQTIIVGASLNAVTCCLHFAGNDRHGFPLLMAGQICAAAAVGTVLQVPAKLATAWFGEDEHATATSVGYLVNIFGSALGYVQSTQMVPDTPNDFKAVANGIFYMNLSQMIFVLVTLVLTYICFENHPPSAPSDLVTAANECEQSLTFLVSLKTLAKDRDFNLYTHAFGLVFGVFVALSIVLDELVCTKVEDNVVGWMGFSCNIFGMVGMLACGVVVDKYKCYKVMSILLVLGSLLSWIAFTAVFLLTNSKIALFALFSLLGFFAIPVTSVGIEQGFVTTYPVPEETSGGIMLIVGNVYGFIAVLCFGHWIAEGRSDIACYVTIAVLFISLVFVGFSRVKVAKSHSVAT